MDSHVKGIVICGHDGAGIIVQIKIIKIITLPLARELFYIFRIGKNRFEKEGELWVRQ